MSIKEELNILREVFILFEDPKDKFVQLMDMAKESGNLSDAEKTDINKINGCTSQAWVVGNINADDTYTFKTDSDSLIVKGLLLILEKIFTKKSAKDILATNGDGILRAVGLEKTITSQRINGFSSALEKIKSIVK
ncbi:MAG: cysteine desulfuration protein SufE [Candidatus Marinimicrobia bacterium]|nr:cysteine desulfuration protein SufE [Candidatus Neomarinimicrobiota bacterium]|tara:strand:- start:644 stop:1051 length:408 start_codon:yes stop_codon:yes gene_type:complete